MESTAKAAMGRGRFLAAGMLFAAALMAWWGGATVAQPPAAAASAARDQPLAIPGAESPAGLVDAAVPPAAEGSPTAAAATNERPSLAGLMRSIAAHERAYLPFRVRTRQTFRMAKDISDEVRKRYPWGDGRQHEYVCTCEQFAPLDWTLTEVRIADGKGNGTQRQVCRPEGLETVLEPDHPEIPVTKHHANPPQFVSVSPLLGVFPLRMTRPSDGMLLSEYYAQDPSQVALDWEGPYAKLTLTFKSDGPPSRYELWLTPIGNWQPFKLRWYLRAEDKEFFEEWEATKFRHSKSARIHAGTIRCRDLDSNAPPGAAENRNRPIAYSIDFVVEESAYGESVQPASVAATAPTAGDPSSEASTDVPLFSPVSRPTPTRPVSGEAAPQNPSVLGLAENPVGKALDPLATPPGDVPRGVIPPETITIETTPDADRSEVMRHVLKKLEQSGTRITPADPLPAFSRTPLMAVIGARQDADGPEIVRLMQTLQKLGVPRFSLRITQEKKSSVIVVAPADATWRMVHTLLEELKKHDGFEADVRVAANNDPLTPTILPGNPAPVSPSPAGASPSAVPSLEPLIPNVFPGNPAPVSTPSPGGPPSPVPFAESPPPVLQPGTSTDTPNTGLPPVEPASPVPPSATLPPQPASSPNPIPLQPPTPDSPPSTGLPPVEPASPVPPSATLPLQPTSSPNPIQPPTPSPYRPLSTGLPLPEAHSTNGPLKVFALRHASVTEAGRIVQQLYGPRINLALDERTNSLLANGYDAGALLDLEELLKVLDVPNRRPGSGVSPGDSVVDPGGLTPDVSGNKRPPLREGSGLLPPDPTVAPVPKSQMTPSELMRRLAPADVGELPSQTRELLERFFGPIAPGLENADPKLHGPAVFRHWNARVEDVASRLVDELRQTPPDQRDPAKVRELRTLVRLQFHLRQLQQRAEVVEFAQRLERIGESIETRERIAGKIVDRRVEELLDPALTWPQAREFRLPADDTMSPGPRSSSVAPRGQSANNSFLPGGGPPPGGGLRPSPSDNPVPDEFRPRTPSPTPNPFGASSSRIGRRNEGAPSVESPFQRQGEPLPPTSNILQPSPAPSVDEPAWANLSGTWKIDIMRDGLRDALADCDDRMAEFEIHGNVLGLRFRRQGREIGLPLTLKFSSAERPRQVEVVWHSDGAVITQTLGALSCDGKKLQFCFGPPSDPNYPKEIAPAENVTYFEAHRIGYDLPQAAATDSRLGTILHRSKDGAVIVALGSEQGIRPLDHLDVFSEQKQRVGELEVTKVLEEDECAARILREEELMPIRIGDRVVKGTTPAFKPPETSQQSPPQAKTSVGRKNSAGVQLDLGKHSGKFLWIDGPGSLEQSGSGTRIDGSYGSRFRLRLSEIPKHKEANLVLTIEIPDEKSLEGSKVVETLQSNTIPLRITDGEIDQVLGGNSMTKVIYRPHGPRNPSESLFEETITFRSPSDVDRLAEAKRHGVVVAVIGLSRKDESSATETPSPLPSPQKSKPLKGIETPAQAVEDPSRPPKTDAERAVARLVLVFYRDHARRAIPALIVNVGGKTLAITTSPATMVPDGAPHAIDRAFVEIPGRPPVAAKYESKWQDPKAELYVFECEEEIPGLPLEVSLEPALDERLSAILPGFELKLRVTSDAAQLRAVGKDATWLVPTHKLTRHYGGLWELDRVLPEGTPLFQHGQLVGLTLLGTRFLGDKAGKSYVVPAQRITEFRARLGMIVNREHGETPNPVPASSPQDPASAARQ